MPSLQGHLLVASPHLRDPNFTRTVVLMVQHDAEGALGLVLNRPSDKLVRDVWLEITGRTSKNLSPIYVGGPIEGPLMAIHTNASFAQQEVIPGLWFDTHRDCLNALVDQGGDNFRLFSGYSGWGEGQLDGEMTAGGWLTLPAKLSHIFATDDDELWRIVARSIGDDILHADRKIRHLPEDPSVN